MNRHIAVALAAMLAFAPAARADDGRTNALIKFADVIAISARCKRLTMDMDKLKAMAVIFSIDVTDGSADHQVLEAMVKGKTADLMANSDEEVCAVGAFLYGRKGVNMPGLLVED